MQNRLCVCAAIGACVVSAASPARGIFEDIVLTEVASGLSSPLGFVQDPSDPDVQYIVEKAGLIKVRLNGVVQPTPFADFSSFIGSTSSELGLLGLAFPADYATSGFFYINHTDLNDDTVIARVQRDAVLPLQADEGTHTPLLTIPQPAANHNGGHIEFGPDGMLYIASGDGGPGGDLQDTGQDRTDLLGAILRIDVSDTASSTYAIPDGNPYDAASGFAQEIWSFGLRNPWRFSFDTGQCGTGAMFIGDVGENQEEEVNYQPPGVNGHNYAWACREGSIPFLGCAAPADAPFIEPFHSYAHAGGNSVTGGFVYRGASMTLNRGRYFFADFISGQVWSMDVSALEGGGSATDLQEHLDTNIFISSFGRDADGELYILDYFGGRVLRIDGLNTPGNIDGIGVVDGADLAALLAAWGGTACGPADLTNDGIVDGADLATLLAAWGQ